MPQSAVPSLTEPDSATNAPPFALLFLPLRGRFRAKFIYIEENGKE
jgi:hypothetical protein